MDLISRHPIYFILSLFCFFPGLIFLLFINLKWLKKINVNDVVVFLFIRLLFLSFFLGFIYFEIKNGLVITSFFTIYVDSFIVWAMGGGFNPMSISSLLNSPSPSPSPNPGPNGPPPHLGPHQQAGGSNQHNNNDYSQNNTEDPRVNNPNPINTSQVDNPHIQPNTNASNYGSVTPHHTSSHLNSSHIEYTNPNPGQSNKLSRQVINQVFRNYTNTLVAPLNVPYTAMDIRSPGYPQALAYEIERRVNWFVTREPADMSPQEWDLLKPIRSSGSISLRHIGFTEQDKNVLDLLRWFSNSKDIKERFPTFYRNINQIDDIQRLGTPMNNHTHGKSLILELSKFNPLNSG